MNKISIVIAGPRYAEFHISYTVERLRHLFPGSELILSSNDQQLLNSAREADLFDKIIFCKDSDELPSLKFPQKGEGQLNNNINKQQVCCYEGILAATNDVVLRLRTDQILLDNKILHLWNKIRTLPHAENRIGRILTSSIFSINPRYSERMPYHISDMLQLGHKEDLLKYFSAPKFSFEYATWYERHQHAGNSNKFEKTFRAKFAVEQWLALHYIFEHEHAFPIGYHNECNNTILENFESIFIDYFFIAHPEDISLRASKFFRAKSYYNTQCYSTRESFELIEKKHKLEIEEKNNYSKKGINKQYFNLLMPVIYSSPVQILIKSLSEKNKLWLKKILEKLAK